MSNKKLIRKTHSSAFKFKVVVQYLKGDSTVSQLSKDFGVGASTINKWLRQFKDGGKDIFERGSSSNNSNQERETSDLYKKIGELTVERDFLKKVLDV
jgi:transposase